MAIFGQNTLFHFILTQMLCLMCHLVIVAFIQLGGYPIIHFFYIIPFMVFLMVILYLSFWRKDKNCDTVFLWILIVFFVLSFPIFMGVYFAFFNKTMQYQLVKVEDCKVTGLIKTFIPGIEQYQMLYINFKQGDKNMLGYGCISSNYKKGGDSNLSIEPQKFYHYGDKYDCGTHKLGESYFMEDQRVLMSERKRLLNYNNAPKKRFFSTVNGKRACKEMYTFSQVKLPSWMCLPPDTYYEDLMSIDSCYVHYYKGSDGAFRDAMYNSESRQNLKELNEFALINFSGLLVPLDQYLSLLILTYCPMIVSFNAFLAPFCSLLIKIIIKERNKIYKYKQYKFLKILPQFNNVRV